VPLPRPAATYSEDLYRFHWPDFGLECIIEAFSQRRDDIATELIVNLEHPNLGGRLYSGRLLLLGPNSRRDIARALSERVEELDWPGILEQVCNLSRERYRRGEPIVRLADVVPDRERRFLYDRYILDQAISILYGDGATAKSSLALRWSVAVAQEYGPVLYLDWEDDAATHAERLRAICTALGIDAASIPIYYQRRAVRLADSVREVRRLIAEKAFVLVIIDSLGMAAGDPNNHEYMIEAVRACRALGIAVLAIHHLPKNAVDKSKPFGSVYASNEARLTWLVEKAQEEDSPEFNILLTNHKSNRTQLYAKRAFRIHFDGGMDDGLMGLSITATDAAQVESFRTKLPVWRHIAAVLKRPSTIADIVKLLAEDDRKVTEAGVRRAINEHKKIFTNVGTSGVAVWALQDTERTVPYGSVRGSTQSYAGF